MFDEAYLDELEREFDANIQLITIEANTLETTRTLPSDILEFYDWFSKKCNKSIVAQGRPGYPQYPHWLAQLEQLSNRLKEKAYAGDPLAKAAILVDEVIQDTSYSGIEEHHVEKTRDILRLLRSISAGAG